MFETKGDKRERRNIGEVVWEKGSGHGAAGIGRAIARRLADEGASVVAADVDGDAAKEVAESMGEGHLHWRVDVRDERQMGEMVNRVVGEWGGLDVMVNNAGVGIAANVEDTSEEDFDRVISVSLKGTFLGMKMGYRLLGNQAEAPS